MVACLAKYTRIVAPYLTTTRHDASSVVYSDEQQACHKHTPSDCRQLNGLLLARRFASAAWLDWQRHAPTCRYAPGGISIYLLYAAANIL